MLRHVVNQAGDIDRQRHDLGAAESQDKRPPAARQKIKRMWSITRGQGGNVSAQGAVRGNGGQSPMPVGGDWNGGGPVGQVGAVNVQPIKKSAAARSPGLFGIWGTGSSAALNTRMSPKSVRTT